MSYRSLISLMPKAPSASLLLDTYTGAAVAYSLRQLRTAYTGAAIRVRRSSDNAEQDINFVGGDLDTQSLLDFVGYNLLSYSEEVNQSVWFKSNLNTTGTPPYIDVETAPDGNLTGDKLIENTVLSSHQVARTTMTILNSTDYNISVYLKQGERTQVQIVSNISGANQTCDLDLTNGSISNNGFANTPVVTSEANGWYRFSVTITSGLTSVTPLTIKLMDSLGNTTYLGDGTSGCYVWGFQLSQTSSVKTYQKTTAVAGGNGFITTWYDQSGNANDSTQATAANQCQIVSSGSLILDADTSKISTTWTSDRYSLTTGISTNTQYLSVSMWNRLSTTNYMAQLGSSSNNYSPLIWHSNSFSNSVRSLMNTVFVHENIATTGRCIMTSLKDASNLKVAYRNGIQLTNTSTESPAAGTLNSFGQLVSNTTSGQYQELIYWDSEQSANRTGIEDNIKTYWDAY